MQFDDLPLRSCEDSDSPVKSRWTFDASDMPAAGNMRRGVAEALSARGVPESNVAVAELLVSELVGNVVRHVGGSVDVAIDVHEGAPVLHVLDRGPGFHFSTRLPRNLMSESGRGLFIVAALAREFSVVPRKDGGSHARVVLPFDVPRRARNRMQPAMQKARIPLTQRPSGLRV